MIVIISDLHMPFHNKKALDKILQYIKDNSKAITHIIQQGDLFDFYYHSKFRKDVDICTPKDELVKGRKAAESMWKKIKKYVPKAKCYQLLGNHDERLKKRISDQLPELSSLLNNQIEDIFGFDGVTTIYDSREVLTIDGISFIHGYLTGLGKHLKQFNCNIVTAHTHQGGIYFEKHNDKILFELNVGHLADSNSLPLSYAPTKVSKSTLGFGVIGDNHIPVFIPLE